MQRSYVAMLLLPLILSAAVPPAAAQPPVGDILSQVYSSPVTAISQATVFLNISMVCLP